MENPDQLVIRAKQEAGTNTLFIDPYVSTSTVTPLTLEQFVGMGLSLRCAVGTMKDSGERVFYLNQVALPGDLTCGQCDEDAPMPPYHPAADIEFLIDKAPCTLISEANAKGKPQAGFYRQDGICSKPGFRCELAEVERRFPQAEFVTATFPTYRSAWNQAALAQCNKFYDSQDNSIGNAAEVLPFIRTDNFTEQCHSLVRKLDDGKYACLVGFPSGQAVAQQAACLQRLVFEEDFPYQCHATLIRQGSCAE